MTYYLTPAQHAVLDVLIEKTDPCAEGADPEGISPKTLSKQCCCKRSSIQLVLNDLLKIGLIFKRFGADVYAPSLEAVSGIHHGTVCLATDEQIATQAKQAGIKMRTARQAMNLSLEDVAYSLGVSCGFYQQCEQGSHLLPLYCLRRFAVLVQHPLDYFLEEA